MKAQTDVLDEFVPSINVEASIVAGHLRPFEGAQRRIWKLGMAGSEREDPRRERASSLKRARRGAKIS